jgi:hypothetical protein
MEIFTPKRLRVAAASALLFLAAGCGRDEAGGGFITAEGQCIDESGAGFSVEPGQSLGIGGADIGITRSGGRTDVLKVENIGEWEVNIKRSDGTINTDDEDDNTSDFSFRVGKIRQRVVYKEEGQEVPITISQSHDETEPNFTIIVRADQDCNDASGR